MKIGKYIITRASVIKKIIIDNYKAHKPEDSITRLIQIYECRIFGLCFYRDENSFKQVIQDLYNINLK